MFEGIDGAVDDLTLKQSGIVEIGIVCFIILFNRNVFVIFCGE
jgi:hypothetical protein